MRKDSAAMRPRLRGDVYVIATADGAYVRNNVSSTLLRGTSTYEWLQQITPYLDGVRSLAELTGGLPDKQRTMIETLVWALVEHGYAKDVTEDRPHSLSDRVAEIYQAEIGFIDYFTDSAELRFQTYRSTDILLVGSGSIIQSLVAAQFDAGSRVVRLALTDECPTDTERLYEIAAAATERDPEQRLEVVIPATDTELATLVLGASVVVHVSDLPMAARARSLARWCAGGGVTLAQALPVGDAAWISPVAAPDQPHLNWESMWRRLRSGVRSSGSGFAFTDDRDARLSEYLHGPTVALVANHLSFACFRSITGIEPPPAVGAVARFDLETLETSNHEFLSHPLAAAVSPTGSHVLSDTIEQLAKMPPMGGEDFSQRVVGLMDEHTGVLGAVDESDYQQVPLFVSRVAVAVQDRGALGHIGQHVFGSGDSIGEARAQATMQALSRYAAVCVDRRRLLCASGAPLPVDDPAAAGWAWAHDLSSGEPRLVPALVAFPALAKPSPPPAVSRPPIGPGVAAAHSWDEAVQAGLAGLCTGIVAGLAAGSTERFAVVDLSSEALSAKATRYRDLLALAGSPATVRDLSAVLGVPAFAAECGGRTVAYQAGRERAAALEACLHTALLHCQSRISDQLDYAPLAVPQLPPSDEVTPRPSLAPPVGEADLVGALRARGRCPVAVVLDHDPSVSAVLPFLVNVVVVDA